MLHDELGINSVAPGDDGELPEQVGPTNAGPFPDEVQYSHRSAASHESYISSRTHESYKALSTKPTAPSITLGARPQRDPNRARSNNVPGPGSYMGPNMDKSSRHSRQPTFGFGTQSRYPKIPSETPGPGEYKPLATLGTGGISCTPRRKEVSKTGLGGRAPGPGDHNLPEVLGGKRGGPKISMTPRRENQEEWAYMAKNPGPGDYDILHRKEPKLNPVKAQNGFGRARQRARLPAELQPPTPGPGSYRIYQELPHAPRGE
mmetsp:Transcript_10340/g.18414  ORF Transcript_10340/g.18414 Transcript_10340/m.18414 type:complete len:261 (+) Transcript_10340:85-867(+)